MTAYSEKLKDPRWQRKRLEVLNRENFTCQVCGDKESTLHVHHLVYHGEPWDAPSDELECLCEHHHEFREALNDQFITRSKIPTIFFSAMFLYNETCVETKVDGRRSLEALPDHYAGWMKIIFKPQLEAIEKRKERRFRMPVLKKILVETPVELK